MRCWRDCRRIYGLYASFLPPLVGALFGSSRQLSTGPAAVVSLLTAVTLEPLATTGSQGYIACAVLLTLMVGVIQFFLGILRLGIVINFLSLPVINGFTNAAAVIIAGSQLPKLFGVDVAQAPNHLNTVTAFLRSIAADAHLPTLMMAILAFVIMYGMKRLVPKVPGILATVVVTTLLSWDLDFYRETSVALPPGVIDVQVKVGRKYHQSNIYRRHDFSLPDRVLLVDDEREFAESMSERLTLQEIGSAA